MDNLGDHIMNADEVGGNEKGKRKKTFGPRTKKANTGPWRNVQVGEDHNPFHASKMLLTFGNGTISNACGIIHSGGTTNVQPQHKEGLHRDWWQTTTAKGSMTKEAFEEWCRYIVEYFSARGRCKIDDPIILLLDGHASRWTHAGLKHLNDNCIYPFCIASHTSAWAQSNDCGVNAKDKKYYGKEKKLWRISHPFQTFTRKVFNDCQRLSMAKMQVCVTKYVTHPPTHQPTISISVLCARRLTRPRSWRRGMQKSSSTPSVTWAHRLESQGTPSRGCGQRQVCMQVHLFNHTSFGVLDCSPRTKLIPGEQSITPTMKVNLDLNSFLAITIHRCRLVSAKKEFRVMGTSPHLNRETQRH